MSSSEEFVVEKVIDKRISRRGNRGEIQYFIKWQGYPESENTWEGTDNLTNCMDLVAQYEMEQKTLRMPRKTEKRRHSSPSDVNSAPISTINTVPSGKDVDQEPDHKLTVKLVRDSEGWTCTDGLPAQPDECNDGDFEFAGGFLDEMPASKEDMDVSALYTMERFQKICGQHERDEKILADIEEKHKDLEKIDLENPVELDPEFRSGQEVSRRIIEGSKHFPEARRPGERAPILTISETYVEFALPGGEQKRLDYISSDQKSCGFRAKFMGIQSSSEKLLFLLVHSCRHVSKERYAVVTSTILKNQLSECIDAESPEFLYVLISSLCLLLRIQPIWFVPRNASDSEQTSFVVRVAELLTQFLTCSQVPEEAALPDADRCSEMIAALLHLDWSVICDKWKVQDSIHLCVVCLKIGTDRRFLCEDLGTKKVLDFVGTVISGIPGTDWEEFVIKLAQEVSTFPSDKRNFPFLLSGLRDCACKNNVRKQEVLCACFAAICGRFREADCFSGSCFETGIKSFLPVLHTLFDMPYTTNFNLEYRWYLILQCLNTVLLPSLISGTTVEDVTEVLNFLKMLRRYFGDATRLNHIILRMNLDIMEIKVKTFKPHPPPLQPQPSSPEKPKKPTVLISSPRLAVKYGQVDSEKMAEIQEKLREEQSPLKFHSTQGAEEHMETE